MGQPQIIEKLGKFLEARNPLIEESDVIYLMVEVRKILDHEAHDGYPSLRFYADWVVHTEKDRITPEVRKIMQEMYDYIQTYIRNPALARSMSPIMQFAYKQELRKEMSSFFKMYSLPLDLVAEDNWITFVSTLVKVLENHPIKNPIPEILSFTFVPAAPRCVAGTVVFRELFEGKKYYEFKNAY